MKNQKTNMLSNSKQRKRFFLICLCLFGLGFQTASAQVDAVIGVVKSIADGAKKANEARQLIIYSKKTVENTRRIAGAISETKELMNELAKARREADNFVRFVRGLGGVSVEDLKCLYNLDINRYRAIFASFDNIQGNVCASVRRVNELIGIKLTKPFYKEMNELKRHGELNLYQESEFNQMIERQKRIYQLQVEILALVKNIAELQRKLDNVSSNSSEVQSELYYQLDAKIQHLKEDRRAKEEEIERLEQTPLPPLMTRLLDRLQMQRQEYAAHQAALNVLNKLDQARENRSTVVSPNSSNDHSFKNALRRGKFKIIDWLMGLAILGGILMVYRKIATRHPDGFTHLIYLILGIIIYVAFRTFIFERFFM